MQVKHKDGLRYIFSGPLQIGAGAKNSQHPLIGRFFSWLAPIWTWPESGESFSHGDARYRGYTRMMDTEFHWFSLHLR